MIEPDPDQLEQVVTWILEGNNPPIIRDSIEKQMPELDPDQILQQAWQQIHDAGGWTAAALMFIYRKQVEIGEYGGAARSLKQMQTPPPPTEKARAFPRIVTTGNTIDDRRKIIEARIAELTDEGDDTTGI